MELCISAIDFNNLHEKLFRAAPDECAAFLATETAGSRIVARSMQVFDGQAFERSAHGELSLSEAAQVDALATLKRGGPGASLCYTSTSTRARRA
jgi:hypothetical protein